MKILYYLLKIMLNIIGFICYAIPIICSIFSGLNIYTLILYTVCWGVGMFSMILSCAIKLKK